MRLVNWIALLGVVAGFAVAGGAPADGASITDAVICRSVSDKGQPVSPSMWFPKGTKSLVVWFRALDIPRGSEAEIRWALNGGTLTTRRVTLRANRSVWHKYEVGLGDALPLGNYEATVKIDGITATSARTRVGGEEPLPQDVAAIIPEPENGRPRPSSGLSRTARSPGDETVAPIPAAPAPVILPTEPTVAAAVPPAPVIVPVSPEPPAVVNPTLASMIPSAPAAPTGIVMTPTVPVEPLATAPTPLPGPAVNVPVLAIPPLPVAGGLQPGVGDLAAAPAVAGVAAPAPSDAPPGRAVATMPILGADAAPADPTIDFPVPTVPATGPTATAGGAPELADEPVADAPESPTGSRPLGPLALPKRTSRQIVARPSASAGPAEASVSLIRPADPGEEGVPAARAIPGSRSAFATPDVPSASRATVVAGRGAGSRLTAATAADLGGPADEGASDAPRTFVLPGRSPAEPIVTALPDGAPGEMTPPTGSREPVSIIDDAASPDPLAPLPAGAVTSPPVPVAVSPRPSDLSGDTAPGPPVMPIPGAPVTPATDTVATDVPSADTTPPSETAPPLETTPPLETAPPTVDPPATGGAVTPEPPTPEAGTAPEPPTPAGPAAQSGPLKLKGPLLADVAAEDQPPVALPGKAVKLYRVTLQPVTEPKGVQPMWVMKVPDGRLWPTDRPGQFGLYAGEAPDPAPADLYLYSDHIDGVTPLYEVPRGEAMVHALRDRDPSVLYLNRDMFEERRADWQKPPAAWQWMWYVRQVDLKAGDTVVACLADMKRSRRVGEEFRANSPERLLLLDESGAAAPQQALSAEAAGQIAPTLGDQAKGVPTDDAAGFVEAMREQGAVGFASWVAPADGRYQVWAALGLDKSWARCKIWTSVP